MTKSIFIIEQEQVGERLDVFLEKKHSGFSRSHFKNLIKKEFVFVNGKLVKAGYCLKMGDVVELTLEEPKELSSEPQNINIDIVYENKDYAIINKPQGLVVHPSAGHADGTLVNALLFHIKNLSGINGVIRPGIVHRIDKDTSGLLVVAKNDSAHVNLSEQIKNKTCKRFYYALLEGNLKNDSGIVETFIGRDPKNRLKMAVVDEQHGKLAITYYDVVKRYENYCLVRFELKTGRTHQIRVHAKYLGHPIVGDSLYNSNKCKFKVSGQMLHAYKLILIDTVSNKEKTFEVELPLYFKNILANLKESTNYNETNF